MVYGKVSRSPLARATDDPDGDAERDPEGCQSLGVGYFLRWPTLHVESPPEQQEAGRPDHDMPVDEHECSQHRGD